MQNSNNGEIFPRLLYEEEKEFLFAALPANKPGYKKYRERIACLFVIGYGRFDGGNYVLGLEDDKPELSVSSAPVLASADIWFEDKMISVLIHREQFGQIEFDIRSADSAEHLSDGKIISTLSDWLPGMNVGKFSVREIHFSGSEHVLAISPEMKRIWIYEKSSGINFPIPVSSYYNELMRLIGDRNPATALNPDRLFPGLADFNDAQLAQAFMNYNKFARHLDPAALVIATEEKKSNKKSLFGFLKNR